MAYGSEVEKLERRWMENPMGVSFAPLAEAYRRAGDHARALEVLAIGLANHPAYVPALIVQARCHLDVQSDGAAEESFLAVLATDGHNLIALKGLADICERGDRPEQASTHLDRLLEADPTHDEGRVQMDRLTGVLNERDRLRGDGAGTVTRMAPEASGPEAEELEPVEPVGFEPTDAGSQDDPSSPDDMTPSVESLVDTGDEPAQEGPDAGDVLDRPDPELIEAIGWDADEAEPVAGAEPTEPDFEVEKEVDPFEAEEAGSPTTPPTLGDADSAVPFEEESPAPWLQESPDEPMADGFRDGSAVELPVETAPVAPESEPESALPVMELEAPPAPGDSNRAPMASAWAMEGAVEPPDHPAVPPVDDVHAAGSAWAEAAEAVPMIEPKLAADAAEAFGTESDTPAADAEGPDERADGVPAWEASAEVPEARPGTAPSALDADDEVTLVVGAESELPADPEPEIEPALIMTETMARLFERQGHRTMALAIYAQLADQAPDNPDLAAAVERLTDELSTGSGTSGAPGKGAAEAAAVDAIVRRGASGPTPKKNRALPDSPESGLRLDAPATRASEDLFSLSAVFGSARPGPTAQTAAFTPGSEATDREPSFDEFFGSEDSAASDGGQAGGASGEDLEQFTAWLRGLKR